MKEILRGESVMAITRRDRSAALLAVTQRLMDAQLLRSLDGGEKVAVTSSTSDHQLMDSAATAKKKKRNKQNKAAAKNKRTKRMSWLGGGNIPLIMMAAAFGSITTLISLSLIHLSDGSSEGKAPPVLPPTASTYLRQGDFQSSMSSTSPNTINPLSAVPVQSPIFSPRTTVNNSPMNSVEKPSFSPILFVCTDTQGWYDKEGYDCSWYELVDNPGCPQYGSQTASSFSTAEGSANDNCCYCQNAAANNVVSES
jgi:hypothetical protein